MVQWKKKIVINCVLHRLSAWLTTLELSGWKLCRYGNMLVQSNFVCPVLSWGSTDFDVFIIVLCLSAWTLATAFNRTVSEVPIHSARCFQSIRLGMMYAGYPLLPVSTHLHRRSTDYCSKKMLQFDNSTDNIGHWFIVCCLIGNYWCLD